MWAPLLPADDGNIRPRQGEPRAADAERGQGQEHALRLDACMDLLCNVQMVVSELGRERRYIRTLALL